MAAANQNGGATAPPAAHAPKSTILTNVLSLASQFGTCVEAFNLIHPHNGNDHEQQVALAKIGIQQGRLLIFGDAVGISSPPAFIARHMIPSHPGATNPDPSVPVNFGARHAQLDDEAINAKVREALDEIAGRPSHLSREEVMEKYGLKSPKKFSTIEHPALDTNRLEAFREKYALLQDLARSSGIKGGPKRTGSITLTRWTVCHVLRFESFVSAVKLQIDRLIALLGVKEQVDRGMRTDIKAMAWHPDISGPVVRKDWEKLRLISEAVATDYPEYVEVATTAMKYISAELKEVRLGQLRAGMPPIPAPIPPKMHDDYEKKPPLKVDAQPIAKLPVRTAVKPTAKTPDKEKRPGFLSAFKLKSWSKSRRNRNKSIGASSEEYADPQRSSSADFSKDSQDENEPTTVRSKSLSALSDEPAPFNLDTKLTDQESAAGGQDETKGPLPIDSPLTAIPTRNSNEICGSGFTDPWDKNALVHADTANSLIDRHDMYRDVGRIETRDIRDKSKEAARAY